MTRITATVRLVRKECRSASPAGYGAGLMPAMRITPSGLRASGQMAKLGNLDRGREESVRGH